MYPVIHGLPTPNKYDDNWRVNLTYEWEGYLKRLNYDQDAQDLRELLFAQYDGIDLMTTNTLKSQLLLQFR